LSSTDGNIPHHGAMLRATRQRAGVSQRELVRYLGLSSPATISHTESRPRLYSDTRERYLAAIAALAKQPGWKPLPERQHSVHAARVMRRVAKLNEAVAQLVEETRQLAEAMG
jgi:transcriptional regulator with XRE-family HTH domain